MTSGVALDPDEAVVQAAGVAWLPDSDQAQQQQLGQALFRLQKWLIEMYRRKYAHEDDEGVVHLNDEVSARFALGFARQDAFLVMPELEAGWASLIPWQYAAMREGEPCVYLVTMPIVIDGAATPDFGVSFQIPDLARAQALSVRPNLQLRRYKQVGAGWSVDPEHFAEMPVLLLGQGAPIFNSGGTLKPRRQGRR